MLSPPTILLTAEATGDADPAIAKSETSVPVNVLIIVLDNNESARGPFFALISTSCPIIFTSLVLFSSSYPILILGDWITISRLASRTICFPLILTAPFSALTVQSPLCAIKENAVPLLDAILG